MAELTKEQIDKACDAGSGEISWEEVFRAAAPYLQLPWDEPTEEEIRDVCSHYPSESHFQILAEMRRLVRRRNAALLPNPVDPRREKIIRVLAEPKSSFAGEIADKILASLDEVKFTTGL